MTQYLDCNEPASYYASVRTLWLRNFDKEHEYSKQCIFVILFFLRLVFRLEDRFKSLLRRWKWDPGFDMSIRSGENARKPRKIVEQWSRVDNLGLSSRRWHYEILFPTHRERKNIGPLVELFVDENLWWNDSLRGLDILTIAINTLNSIKNHFCLSSRKSVRNWIPIKCVFLLLKLGTVIPMIYFKFRILTRRLSESEMFSVYWNSAVVS